jgi:hypothetical protein
VTGDWGQGTGDRRQVTGDWRKLHIENLCELYFSQNFLRRLRMPGEGHLEYMEKENVHKVSVGTSEGRDQ